MGRVLLFGGTFEISLSAAGGVARLRSREPQIMTEFNEFRFMVLIVKIFDFGTQGPIPN